jgi:hypothetical protein
VKRLAFLAAAFGLVLSAPAHAAIDPLTPTAAQPGDGAVISPTPTNIPLRLDGLPSGAHVTVLIASQPTTVADGLSLSALNRVGGASLSESEPGVFTGSFPPEGPQGWTNTPGTYYWQATMFWADSPGPPGYHGTVINRESRSPIYTLTVAVPAPVVSTPSLVFPPTVPAPILNTSMTAPVSCASRRFKLARRRRSEQRAKRSWQRHRTSARKAKWRAATRARVRQESIVGEFC